MKTAIILLCLAICVFAGQPLPERLRNKGRGQPLPARLWPKEPRPVYASDKLLGKSTQDRIVGGRPAKDGEVPYIISLQRKGWSGGWSHSCGGSILNENTIITAAHCVDGAAASSLQIRYNTLRHATGGELVAIKTVKGHPNYNSRNIDNDVAIIITAKPLTISGNVGVVVLPDQGSDLAGGTQVTVSGWGTTSQGGSLPAALMTVDVPSVSREKCREQYGQEDITDQMVCAGIDAGGIDSCQGDSGGPLVQKGTNKQVGVVSWGYGCAQPGKSGVYANVGSFVTWFNANKE